MSDAVTDIVAEMRELQQIVLYRRARIAFGVAAAEIERLRAELAETERERDEARAKGREDVLAQLSAELADDIRRDLAKEPTT